MLAWQAVLFAQDRFPRPEFESGYVYPEHQMPLQRAPVWEYIDLAVLIGALSIASWLALKKRSRQGLVWLSVFSLAYFGFFREGCVCSVGSLQNVSLALFNEGYAIPLTVLLFFIIPLIFALAFGRVFCAGVCPLGAIQELTGFRTVKLPKVVESVMISIPFIYLGVSVLSSATESQFLICRYDPFVGIFRLDAPYTMIIFGALLLVAGIFINRPYCRYLCPYGVLLNVFSRFSQKHLTVTPAECTNCRLCEDVCPYDAILPSDIIRPVAEPQKERKRFLIYLVLIPFFAAGGAILFRNLSPVFAGLNGNVRLAREIRAEKENGVVAVSKAAIAFKEAGKTEKELFDDEIRIHERFRKGSIWMGIFLGTAFGLSLVSLSTRTRRTGYVPHKGKCYSCGRCFQYCPIHINKRVSDEKV
ncbi:MAG TPA: 4Fe-4S ferredoxin [Bacteroidales bacterium]|nr:4Fe-4S ferredoxin [Bacteroidales bacterium]HBZ19804.1 4Fe-4S ferredoxin [Bacteroidales bacterium]